MTIKTPAEITRETLAKHGIESHFVRQGWTIGDVIHEAIEADRAQRSPSEYVSEYVSEIDGVYVVDIHDYAGTLRVNLNDSPIWNADTETHAHKICPCAVIDARVCDQCGDAVQYLDSRDWCDACNSSEQCAECGTNIESYDTHAGGGMCGTCNHDAARSGA